MNNDISNPRPIGDFISEQVLSTIYGLGLAIATWIVLPSIVFGAFNNSLLSALKTGAVFAGILMQVSHIPGVLEVGRKICLSTTIGYPAITHYVVIFNIDQALLFLIILGGVLAPTIKRVRRRKKSITSKKRGQSKGSTPDVKTVKAARADGFIPELNIQVGNFWLEPKFFNMHMLIAGSTGGGKSVLITGMLGTIRKRGERAVILDPGAAFMAKGYSPKGGDIIVSPYDARTHRWDPVSEIRRLPEARGLAEAIVPEGHGESGVWHEYARSFLSDIITSLLKRGELTNANLLYFLVEAPRAGAGSLRELVADTTSKNTIPEDGKIQARGQTQSIINILERSTEWLQDLNNVPTDRPAFSMRDYLSNAGRGWVWLPIIAQTKAAQLRAMRAFISTMFKTALSLPPQKSRLWFFIDELPSLGKINDLSDGLNQLRDKNITVSIAIQSTAQLIETYGRDGAAAMLDAPALWAVFACRYRDTAEVISNQFGGKYKMIRSTSNQRGNSAGGSTSSSSTSMSEQFRRWVEPNEIQHLKPLTGFLWAAGYASGPSSLRVTPQNIEAKHETEVEGAWLLPNPDAYKSSDAPPATPIESGAAITEENPPGTDGNTDSVVFESIRKSRPSVEK